MRAMGSWIRKQWLRQSIALAWRLADIQRQAAQGMVEYGLLIALIAIIAIGGLIALGFPVAETFQRMGRCLAGNLDRCAG